MYSYVISYYRFKSANISVSRVAHNEIAGMIFGRKAKNPSAMV